PIDHAPLSTINELVSSRAMLRSVFAVGHGKLAVAFDGGHVLEVGESSGETYRVQHLRHGSNRSSSSSSSSSSTPNTTSATGDAKNESPS
ncbi:unnamed protein product, partial [Ectocarpus sp. 6 AP-2014]